MAEPVTGTGPDGTPADPDRGRGSTAPAGGSAAAESAGAGPAADATLVPDAPAHGRHREPGHGSGWLRLLREVGVVVVAALVISVVVRAFLVQAFYVPSASMEDTLLISDRILASKITTRLTGVHRGEVVVFRDPGGWLPAVVPDETSSPVRSALEFVGLLPTDTGQDLVKRVIGVGGDRVSCCDAQSRIVLNGVPLDEASYLKPGSTTDQVRFDILVPAGTVFVMGDNRGDSRDSRYHLDVDNGGVPVDNVVGRVVLVVWPFDRFATVPIPDIYGNPALDADPGG